MSSSDDSNAIASFNKTHPLDFNLYEGENKEPVIFIENGTKGQELILEIVNDSGQTIYLPPKNAVVSATNYHFELRFRPDTLSPNSLQQTALQPNQNWSMSSPVSQSDGLVSLYFLNTNTNDQPLLNANHTESLTIQNLNGAAAGGARTTRAELMCPQFTYQGENLNNYYREKSLSIVSHRGKKNIPLHVGFVGSNRILNDGTSQNTLNLRITNVSKDRTIPFNPDSSGDQASKLIISFDIDSPWALGRKDQVQPITISLKSTDWQIKQDTEGESPIWTITNDKDAGLAAEQAIELTIGNIISSLPSGNTNLYLRYENIPGYWDGTFISTIEKMPIWYDRDGNVGIGTTNLDAKKLKVQGNANITGELKVQGDTEVDGDTDVGGNASISGELKVQGDTEVDGNTDVRGNASISGTLTVQQNTNVKGNADITGTLKVESNTKLGGDANIVGSLTAHKIEGIGAFVPNMIIIWTGDINHPPTGWEVCNGMHGTPDLTKNFIRGDNNPGYHPSNFSAQGNIEIAAREEVRQGMGNITPNIYLLAYIQYRPDLIVNQRLFNENLVI